MTLGQWLYSGNATGIVFHTIHKVIPGCLLDNIQDTMTLAWRRYFLMKKKYSLFKKLINLTIFSSGQMRGAVR